MKTANKKRYSVRNRRIRHYRDGVFEFSSFDADADGGRLLRRIAGVGTDSNIDLEDAGFEQTLMTVVKKFSEGCISAYSAARTLGVSLQEFLAEFVFNEASLRHLDREEREMLIMNAAEALREIKAGRTIRGFVRECVLTEEQLVIAASTMEEEAAIRLRDAVESLPATSLGIALRQSLSVGYTVPEFVELFIFTKEWQVVAGVDDEAAAALINEAVAALQLAHEYLLSESRFSALHVREKEIPDRIVSRLSSAIARRRIRDARELITRWDNRHLLAAVLLNLYAQWIDFDSSYLSRVETALVEFRHQPIDGRSTLDSANLDVAEGLVHLHYERYKKAIVHFKYAMKGAHSIKDRDLMATCLYYLSRAYWKLGLYEKALGYAGRAKKRNKILEREAAIEMLEGWLLLLLSHRKEAESRLDHARDVFAKTDDYTNHGNALSFSGRLCKDEEQYDKALDFFEDAVWSYQRADPKHRNIARTYVNMADVCFLHARTLSQDPSCPERVLERRLEAFEYLEAAEEIYNVDRERNYRGLGDLHNLRGLLYAASGEFERAKVEIEKALFFGSQKKDHIVIGKARKNQSIILTAETRGPATSDNDNGQVSNQAILAFATAEEGLRHALQTNNKRLQARCYLSLGHSLLRLNRDYRGAEQCHAAARDCVDPGLSEQSSSQANTKQQSYWQIKFNRLQHAIDLCKGTTAAREYRSAAEN
jgi:tetratricopeptide (TPR) repeat protein